MTHPEEPTTEEMAVPLTEERRAEVESALFGDEGDLPPQARLERVCEALFWTMAMRMPTTRSSRKAAGQSTIDFIVSEVRNGRSKRESQGTLMTMREELQAEVGSSDVEQ